MFIGIAGGGYFVYNYVDYNSNPTNWCQPPFEPFRKFLLPQSGFLRPIGSVADNMYFKLDPIGAPEEDYLKIEKSGASGPGLTGYFKLYNFVASSDGDYGYSVASDLKTKYFIARTDRFSPEIFTYKPEDLDDANFKKSNLAASASYLVLISPKTFYIWNLNAKSSPAKKFPNTNSLGLDANLNLAVIQNKNLFIASLKPDAEEKLVLVNLEDGKQTKIQIDETIKDLCITYDGQLWMTTGSPGSTDSSVYKFENGQPQLISHCDKNNKNKNINWPFAATEFQSVGTLDDGTTRLVTKDQGLFIFKDVKWSRHPWCGKFALDEFGLARTQKDYYLYIFGKKDGKNAVLIFHPQHLKYYVTIPDGKFESYKRLSK